MLTLLEPWTNLLYNAGMADIPVGTLFTVKQNVWWNGEDIGGRAGEVIDSESYVLAVVEDVDGEVKLFRSEIEKPMTEEQVLEELFRDQVW